MPKPAPENDGTRYQAMEIQITTRIAPRKYFLNAPEVCRNRIILLETPELCGKPDYKAGGEKLPSLPLVIPISPQGGRGTLRLLTREPAPGGPFKPGFDLNGEIRAACFAPNRTARSTDATSHTRTNIRAALSLIQTACCTSTCSQRARGPRGMPSPDTHTPPWPRTEAALPCLRARRRSPYLSHSRWP